MTHKATAGECSNCESSYLVSYTYELASKDTPEYCPFCGEIVEDIDDVSEEYNQEDGSLDDPEWE